MTKTKPGRRPITYNLPQVDYRGLLKLLGTDRRIVKLLKFKTGITVPESSVTGWRWRNTVPSPWVPTVIQIAMELCFIGDPEDIVLKDRRHMQVLGIPPISDGEYAAFPQ